MISRFAMGMALVALAGCGASSIPDSNPNRGVGFGDYNQYQAERERRDAILAGRAQDVAQPMSEEVLIAQDTMNVLGQADASQPATVDTTIVATAPATGNPNISDEQNFDAVASRETIESDRERLARQRDTFQTAQPEAVPERPSGPAAPNIVTYALATTNPVGQPAYSRSNRFNEERYRRACNEFASSDQAQAAFLAAGGPERDRRGLDPDGDGFACFWDPRPFRTARGG